MEKCAGGGRVVAAAEATTAAALATATAPGDGGAAAKIDPGTAAALAAPGDGGAAAKTDPGTAAALAVFSIHADAEEGAALVGAGGFARAVMETLGLGGAAGTGGGGFACMNAAFGGATAAAEAATAGAGSRATADVGGASGAAAGALAAADAAASGAGSLNGVPAALKCSVAPSGGFGEITVLGFAASICVAARTDAGGSEAEEGTAVPSGGPSRYGSDELCDLRRGANSEDAAHVAASPASSHVACCNAFGAKPGKQVGVAQSLFSLCIFPFNSLSSSSHGNPFV